MGAFRDQVLAFAGELARFPDDVEAARRLDAEPWWWGNLGSHLRWLIIGPEPGASPAEPGPRSLLDLLAAPDSTASAEARLEELLEAFRDGLFEDLFDDPPLVAAGSEAVS